MQVEEKFLTGECGKGGRCMIEVGLNPIQSEAKAYFFFFFFFFSLPITGTVRGNVGNH